MAHTDPILSAAPVAGIAGPHQSTVATILRAAELGLFTAAQAELLIDRVRAHLNALPVVLLSSVQDGAPVHGNSPASPPRTGQGAVTPRTRS
jgi:hypothetical protein